MFSLSYTNTTSKLKYVFYKTNKLMQIYSYIITSLPEKVQVYNNTTTSSPTAIAYTIGWSGHVAPTARWAWHRARILGTLVLVELKGMAPLMPSWSRPQALSVGMQLMAFPADLSMAYPIQVLSRLHTG